MEPFTDWLTPASAARRLQVTPNRIRALLKQRRLAYVMTPLGRLISPQAVEDFATERAERQRRAAERRAASVPRAKTA